MTPPSGTTPGLPRSPPSTTFSDALVSLGFNAARTESFDWFTAYPTAQPLLRAIQNFFTRQCVLTEEQCARYEANKETYAALSDDELIQLARPLTDVAAPLGDRSALREARLLATKERLASLTAQSHLLGEAVQEKRARTGNPATPVSRASRLAQGLDDEQSLAAKAEMLRTAVRRDPPESGWDVGMEAYREKERAYFEEILTCGRQCMDEKAASAGASSEAEQMSASTARSVKLYGDVKGDHFMHEARLSRANAVLASLSLAEGAYLEMSTTSLRPVIEDLRSRATKALDAKRRQVSEQAQDELWRCIDEISFSETLRQQDRLIEVAQFFAKACLEQRARILCYSIATMGQIEGYGALIDALTLLVRTGAVSPSPRAIAPPNIVDGEAGEKGEALKAVDGNECRTAEKVPTNCYSENELESHESYVFESTLRDVTDMLRAFRLQVGGDENTLLLEGHPEYAVLVEKVEKVLNRNTAILEAVLRKKSSHQASGSRNRDWAHYVNTRLERDSPNHEDGP